MMMSLIICSKIDKECLDETINMKIIHMLKNLQKSVVLCIWNIRSRGGGGC